MTNILTPKAGIDPTHGRKVVDQLTKEVAIRVKSMSTSRPFVAFVIIAALALGLYYFILAAPIYISETSFQVRGREAPSGGSGAAGGLLAAFGGGGGGGGVSSSDLSAIEQYVHSYDMANKLDQRFHLREIYSRPRPDFLHWMSPNASRENYLSYFRKMVVIRVDHDTNLVTVQSKAFDPVLAQQMSQAIMGISADYINELSAALRKETVRSSEQELRKAQDSARQARLAMTSYRTNTGLIDPMASAAATSTGMAGMQQEIVQSRAEMAQLLSFNTPRSPAVMQIKARIAGLEEQIAAEQKRVSNTGASDSIDERLRQYASLQISSEYAEKQLVEALTAYDSATAQASQRERFIVPVIPPNLPQSASEPHRVSAFLEAMFVLIAVYGIVALAIAGVRDHQGI